MRRYVIAGNWKMNMTPSQTRAFIKELAPMVEGLDKCDIVLCGPYVDIATAVEAAEGTNIHVGAENVHFEKSGAFTGEIPLICSRRSALSTLLSVTPSADSISVRLTLL